jgi:hypothetical protein
MLLGGFGVRRDLLRANELFTEPFLATSTSLGVVLHP